MRDDILRSVATRSYMEKNCKAKKKHYQYLFQVWLFFDDKEGYYILLNYWNISMSSFRHLCQHRGEYRDRSHPVYPNQSGASKWTMNYYLDSKSEWRVNNCKLQAEENIKIEIIAELGVPLYSVYVSSKRMEKFRYQKKIKRRTRPKFFILTMYSADVCRLCFFQLSPKSAS